MKRLIVWLRHGALVIEWLLGVLWYLMTFWIPRKKAHPVADVYNAIHHPNGVYLFGRVMALRVMSAPKPEDGKWVNFKRMASNWFTLDFPNARVEVRMGERLITVRSNKEGYFELHDSCSEEIDEVEVSLPQHGYSAVVPLVGSQDCSPMVVISDVDDTLMETGSISMGKMLETTLFGNSLTRELVPGVSGIINELHEGGRHPVFYVTSSPWNLANFLKRVFQRAQLPTGGLFMTNWGLTPEQWLTPSHDVHKREAIDEVAGWYREARFVLLGDDSQRDPEIYAKALRDYGVERVCSILIRSVSGELRANEVRGHFEQINREFGDVAHVVDGADRMREILVEQKLIQESDE
ncbi:phosphatase domain-containing protein [Rubritalea tangerina]|uniref:Phosphatase domain-containing protein n=1 Tax=Rubritalea tangerina TaxID=430798 RepID=A0ABW4Z7N7_9BACT